MRGTGDCFDICMGLALLENLCLFVDLIGEPACNSLFIIDIWLDDVLIMLFFWVAVRDISLLKVDFIIFILRVSFSGTTPSALISSTNDL